MGACLWLLDNRSGAHDIGRDAVVGLDVDKTELSRHNQDELIRSCMVVGKPV